MVHWCVVWKADVEEARVFLSDKLVHVIYRGSDKKYIVSLQRHRSTLLCLDARLSAKDFLVLVVDEIIVLELLVNFVVRSVVEAAKNEAEED